MTLALLLSLNPVNSGKGSVQQVRNCVRNPDGNDLVTRYQRYLCGSVNEPQTMVIFVDYSKLGLMAPLTRAMRPNNFQTL